MPVTDQEIVRRLRAFKGHGTNLSRAAANRIERLGAAILNIQALAEQGFPIDAAKLAERCRHARDNGE